MRGEGLPLVRIVADMSEAFPRYQPSIEGFMYIISRNPSQTLWATLLKTKNLRLRDVRESAQGHTVSKWQTWDSNPGVLDAKTHVLNCCVILRELYNHIKPGWNPNFVTWMWSNPGLMVLTGTKCDKVCARPVPGAQECLSCGGSLASTSGSPRGHSPSFLVFWGSFWKLRCWKSNFLL